MNNLIKDYIDNNLYNLDNNINTPKDRVAIIIETREIPHLKWVINNIKYYTGWDVILFNNKNLVDCDCEIVNLNYDMDHVKYNNLLKDVSFWNSFDQEHILIFQSDSFMLKSGIDDYLNYDYVGAPWNWANDPSFKDRRYKDLSIFRNGGNGGFSLRKKSVMIDILMDKYKNPSSEDKYINEDMFFSKYVKNYPSLEDMRKFCVETMFCDDPIAVHAFDRYLNDDQIKRILSK